MPGSAFAGAVVSPTFVIARVHRGGRLPLVHVDAYRLGSFAEVDDLDLDVDLDDSVVVVEWGAGLVEQLPRPGSRFGSIARTGTEERVASNSCHTGGDWAERVTQLTRP